MTVPAKDFMVEYTITAGQAGQTEFSFDFPAKRAEHIHCFDIEPRTGETDTITVIPSSGFSVTPAAEGLSGGGIVTLAQPLPVGHVLRIERQTPKAQEKVFTNQNRIWPEQVEDALDLIQMQIQENGTEGVVQRVEIIVNDVEALQQRDDQLQANINAEATARSDADAGLQTQISNLSARKADQSYVDAELAGKAPVVHTHTREQVEGLSASLQAIGTALNGKADKTLATESEPGLFSPGEKIKLANINPSESGLPSGGELGDALVNTGSGGAWVGKQSFYDAGPKGSASVFGTVKVDGTTIASTGGVLSVIGGSGGGGEGTSDHRALSNRDAEDQHPTSAITGLDDSLSALATGLASKANATDVTQSLAGKANTNHSQAMSTIDGLTNALNAKQSVADMVNYATVSALTTGLSDKAATVHTHAQNEITNLPADLAAKAPLASPEFSGAPKAPTPTASSPPNQIATKEYVDAKPAGGTYNQRTIYGSSKTETVQESGWRRILLIGGGGGGGKGGFGSVGGVGGGQGGTTSLLIDGVLFASAEGGSGGGGGASLGSGGGGAAGKVVDTLVYLRAGQTITITIGAGGIGGAYGTGTALGGDGAGLTTERGSGGSTSTFGGGGAFGAGHGDIWISGVGSPNGGAGASNDMKYGGGGGGGGAAAQNASSTYPGGEGGAGGDGAARGGDGVYNSNSGNGGTGGAGVLFMDMYSAAA